MKLYIVLVSFNIHTHNYEILVSYEVVDTTLNSQTCFYFNICDLVDSRILNERVLTPLVFIWLVEIKSHVQGS